MGFKKIRIFILNSKQELILVTAIIKCCCKKIAKRKFENMESNYENKIQLQYLKKSCSGAFCPNFLTFLILPKNLANITYDHCCESGSAVLWSRSHTFQLEPEPVKKISGSGLLVFGLGVLWWQSSDNSCKIQSHFNNLYTN